MNEDFLIRIDGRMEQGDESDTVQLMTRGSFVCRGGSFFISYKESQTTGYEGCTTTVKVAKDESKVSLTRFGPAAGQLVVEKGTRHLCHYDTGYGALTLGVAADEIHSRLTDEGGEVEFSYTLDSDQNTILSRNLVKISVKRTAPLT
ncbi:DUF1934 domain-containing protein [Candidatus Allofournierella merdavium]|uniref:DUF1934 domain-containing protein n=1 Tax=Candidatus Allofournierella merdavium TaxID=2838593 RepID=UPI00374FBBDC